MAIRSRPRSHERTRGAASGRFGKLYYDRRTDLTLTHRPAQIVFAQTRTVRSPIRHRYLADSQSQSRRYATSAIRQFRALSAANPDGLMFGSESKSLGLALRP